MKLTKEEFIEKVTAKEIDDDLKMELLEDIADSIDNTEVVVSEDEFKKMSDDLDELSMKYEELKKKYIERFTTSDDDEKSEDEEEKEEEIIDVKEI